MGSTQPPSHNISTGPMSLPWGYPRQVRTRRHPARLGWGTPPARTGMGYVPLARWGWGTPWLRQGFCLISRIVNQLFLRTENKLAQSNSIKFETYSAGIVSQAACLEILEPGVAKWELLTQMSFSLIFYCLSPQSQSSCTGYQFINKPRVKNAIRRLSLHNYKIWKENALRFMPKWSTVKFTKIIFTKNETWLQWNNNKWQTW